MTDAASTFEAHRERLLRLAYGMLGRVSRAEDVVQDAYLRWGTADPDEVDDPEAYLSTIVTRLCLDELTSARAEREQYTGPWLPEPVVETESHPDVPIEETSELSMALLVLLDDLRPIERAVYVLREAFDRPYAEIARLVDRTEAHCRKIAQRARTRIDANGDDIDAPPAAHAELLGPFVEALKRGDPEALAEMLADDVTHYTDGGDLPGAAKRPIEGLDRVTRFYRSIASDADEDIEVRPIRVNGRPGLLALQDDRVHSVWGFRVANGQIQAVYTVMNPDKLQALPDPFVPGGGTEER
ncbi:MAG: RNA polymerase sigma-70 factor [Salinibacter sp.]